MKALFEQGHYEVLEIGMNASLEEIKRAYQVARATYESDSLALYSVFEERDAAVISERVDEAYRVLSDASARRAYDLSVTGQLEADEYEPRDLDVAVLPTVATEELREAGESFRGLEADVEDEDGDFDGAKLRRARLRRGIDLDEVAGITKVSVSNLRHIEEENFGELPATVYIRGFVVAYARTIGLDPRRVAPSYMERAVLARENQGRSSLLGRL